MSSSNNKINWYNTIIGAGIIAMFFYPLNYKINDSDLTTKTIMLNNNIEYLGGRSNSPSYYRLWANKTKADFIINVAGEIAARGKSLDSLKRGDTVTIQYYANRENDLTTSKDIPIYFLKRGDTIYFDKDSYARGDALYGKRLRWLILIPGIIFILGGLKIISERTGFIIGGISLLLIIILRMLNKF